jgi:hypothetical protein
MNRARLSLRYGVPLCLVIVAVYEVGKWMGVWA